MTTGPSPRCRLAGPSRMLLEPAPGLLQDGERGARLAGPAGTAAVGEPVQAEPGEVDLAGRIRRAARGYCLTRPVAADQQVQVAVDVDDLDQPGGAELAEQSGEIQLGIPPAAGGPAGRAWHAWRARGWPPPGAVARAAAWPPGSPRPGPSPAWLVTSRTAVRSAWSSASSTGRTGGSASAVARQRSLHRAAAVACPTGGRAAAPARRARRRRVARARSSDAPRVSQVLVEEIGARACTRRAGAWGLPAASARSASASQPFARDRAGPRRLRIALPRRGDGRRPARGPGQRHPAGQQPRLAASAEPSASSWAAARSACAQQAVPTPVPAAYRAWRSTRMPRARATRRAAERRTGGGRPAPARSAASRIGEGERGLAPRSAATRPSWSPGRGCARSADGGVRLAERVAGQAGRQQHRAPVDAQVRYRACRAAA